MWRAAAALAAGLLALAALLFAYAVAGTIGGLVPRNAGWREPARGITVRVEDSGVHTTLVLPRRAAGVDWGEDFPPTDLADPRMAAHGYVAISWGERGFFLKTPTWWDVRPGTVLRAALGSGATLLHVEHVPEAAEGARAVRLRPAEYRRLAAFIRRVRAGGGALPGYGANDAFYPARGRDDARRTCNAWTGDALAAAGVRTGWWTPFGYTVTWWLRA